MLPHIQWEADLAHCYSDKQRQHALQTIYRATKCSAFWKLTEKLSLRWYMTPTKIASFSPQNPGTCWRCKEAKGDMIQIFWTCSHVQEYWKNIFKNISDITNSPVHSSPELAVLNLTIKKIPKPFRHVTTHILLATRLSLTRLWKTDQIPTIANTIDLVNLHYSYETIMATNNSQVTKTQDIWKPWSQWSRAAKFI